MEAPLFDTPSEAASAAASAAGQGAGPPTDLHPALWRAAQLGRPRDGGLASGFAALDAALPGGGWPLRALTELLLPAAGWGAATGADRVRAPDAAPGFGVGEVRLLAPALAAAQQGGRSLMWFDPPARPFGWALAACGIDVQRLYVVLGRDEAARGSGRAAGRGLRGLLPAADTLWALEQALKSGHLGAVVAWLPARLGADALRRLQLAAQAHDGPVFLLRDERERSRPSPAPLRLLLRAAGPDALRVQLLKRRGPPLVTPIDLALPAVLPAPVHARLAAGRRAAAATGPRAVPAVLTPSEAFVR